MNNIRYIYKIDSNSDARLDENGFSPKNQIGVYNRDLAQDMIVLSDGVYLVTFERPLSNTSKLIDELMVQGCQYNIVSSGQMVLHVNGGGKLRIHPDMEIVRQEMCWFDKFFKR